MDRQTLAEVLKAVSPGLVKNSISDGEFIFMNGQVYASNPSFEMSSPCLVQGIPNGAIVDAKRLKGFVDSAKGDHVQFSTNEDQTTLSAKIGSSEADFSLKFVQDDTFTINDMISVEDDISIFDSIMYAFESSSSNEGTPSTNGVHMKLDDNNLVVEGTNGSIITKLSISELYEDSTVSTEIVRDTLGKFDIVIPYNIVKIASKIKPTYLGYSQHMVLFENDKGVSILSPIKDVEFPDCSVPLDKHTMETDGAAVLSDTGGIFHAIRDKLDEAKYFVDTAHKAVRLSSEDDKISIIADGDSTAKYEAVISKDELDEFNGDIPEFSVALNLDYLNKLIQFDGGYLVIGDGFARSEYGDSFFPCVDEVTNLVSALIL